MRSSRHADPPPAPSDRTTAKQIERKVASFISQRRIVQPDTRAVVALSGGPDSTALVLLLSGLAGDLHLHLTIAHFDHRLRGRSEAAADLDYARDLASSLRLPFSAAGGDVRRRVKSTGESLEDAARRMRYAFLARCAASAAAPTVLTGHTMDDQAETVLLHITRGSAAGGLAAMRPVARWPFGKGPTIARPLLCLLREETELYCSLAGLEPRRDETNEIPEAARNRLRLKVIPELRRLNPRVVEALARLADAAAADAEYLDAAAAQVSKNYLRAETGGVSLPKRDLAGLPRAIASRIVRLAFERLAGTAADIETGHIDTVLEMAGRPPGRLSLPRNVTVQSDSRTISFRRSGAPAPAPIEEQAVLVPGVTLAGAWRIECDILDRPAGLMPRDAFEAYIAASAGALSVRSRRPGDRLRPLGLGGEKKLQDVLTDARVPVGERDNVPVICAEWGIVWVAGHCIDERAAVPKGAERVIRVTARKNS